MNLLISVGRFSVELAALLVVLAGVTIGGGAGAAWAGTGSTAGMVVGGIIGLLIAGTLFGAIAALFQIAETNKKMLALLEQTAPH